MRPGGQFEVGLAEATKMMVLWTSLNTILVILAIVILIVLIVLMSTRKPGPEAPKEGQGQ